MPRPNDKHLERFAGKKVVDYELGKPLRSLGTTAYRLRSEYEWGDVEHTFNENLRGYLADRNAGKTTTLVVGGWNDATEWNSPGPGDAVEQLVGARHVLKNLKALFFGDITYRENEISWIRQGDLSPIFAAYEKLEHAAVRGGNGLRFGALENKHLKQLTIESGGLWDETVDDICRSSLPALTHLDLWIGKREYGASVTLENLAPALSGKAFPKLKHLGLKNAEFMADVLADIVKSPVMKQLDTLDISLGQLIDAEAEPLLTAPAVKKLKAVDVSENYLTKEFLRELKKQGVRVKSSEQREPEVYDDEVYRYVIIGE